MENHRGGLERYQAFISKRKNYEKDLITKVTTNFYAIRIRTFATRICNDDDKARGNR